MMFDRILIASRSGIPLTVPRPCGVDEGLARSDGEHDVFVDRRADHRAFSECNRGWASELQPVREPVRMVEDSGRE